MDRVEGNENEKEESSLEYQAEEFGFYAGCRQWGATGGCDLVLFSKLNRQCSGDVYFPTHLHSLGSLLFSWYTCGRMGNEGLTDIAYVRINGASCHNWDGPRIKAHREHSMVCV